MKTLKNQIFLVPRKALLFSEMKDFSREELEKEYDLELDRIVREVKRRKAKIVCIQLPDGLKSKATQISEFIEGKTNSVCLIWMGTCFGACDIPNLPKQVDLLIQFGHSELGS